jgi:type VI secretion system protein ImpC
MAPHVLRDDAAQRQPAIAAAQAVLAADMRALLHDPALQALEATWRGVHALATNLALDDGGIELHLLDICRKEMAADFDAAGGEPGRSGLHRALVEAGNPAWSLWVADMSLGPQDEDLRLLASLAALSATAGAPVLAGASPALLGLAGYAPPWPPLPWQPSQAADRARWAALRQSALAPWIGLVAPRVLLRRPYGARSDAIDAFAFEEMPPGSPASDLLWGNGAFAAAGLIGRAFAADGWDGELDAEREIADLPAWVYDDAGEPALQAVAEAYLHEQAAQALLDAGIMPLLSQRQRNAALLMRWTSIASPPQPLARLHR